MGKMTFPATGHGLIPMAVSRRSRMAGYAGQSRMGCFVMACGIDKRNGCKHARPIIFVMAVKTKPGFLFHLARLPRIKTPVAGPTRHIRFIRFRQLVLDLMTDPALPADRNGRVKLRITGTGFLRVMGVVAKDAILDIFGLLDRDAAMSPGCNVIFNRLVASGAGFGVKKIFNFFVNIAGIRVRLILCRGFVAFHAGGLAMNRDMEPVRIDQPGSLGP
jgi:hypothetical protein